MHEEKYTQAINKIKEIFPKYKDVRFDITDGVLGFIADSRYPVNNMGELQTFVNTFLNQKIYKVQCIEYINVYADSEEHAIEYVKYIKPRSIIKI